MQLITFLDIKNNVKQISEHIDDERIKNAIIEAQEIDLSPIISEQVYISILEKEGTYSGKYKYLMEGCIYEFEGVKYELRGIKVALSYFAYARIIKGIDNNVSRSGFLQKENDYSIHAIIKERLVAVNEAAGNGIFYAQKCLQYIQRNESDFPVVKPCTTSKKKYSINALGD
ncbi:MAG: hypothetical protein ACOYOV_05120 [Bacteroidales bacterium]